ncbi:MULTISPECIES: iron chaperone [unclassified Halomonas]|uniref:iron chaperone n=1 Tax=unclassified Halomonas TaxID=2609666 RepID=UPI001CF343DF|nr:MULTISPECIES: DUF1801 domain-containing protein [unclassified Halomonas]MCA8863984.1 DUF1801 domain-containing protein [Halomonas sp. SBBP1]UZH11227.1 DUF1801 domain-containing protein [Halomonas sp. BDJS001]
MSSSKFSSVEDYLSSLDSEKGNTLRNVIEVILKKFPELDCKLAWNVPQICKDSDYIFGVSALKNHLALAPWSARVMEDFKTRLENEGYVVKKNLFQIPSGWEIDEKLLRDLVIARLAEMD